MKRLFTLVSILIIIGLVVTACGTATEEPAPAAQPTAAEAEPTMATEEATEAPPAEGGAFEYNDDWGVVVVKAGDPIMLGFAAGLSGAGIDVLGIDEQRGAELAVKDVGQVQGFPLELEVEDSLCSGEGGTAVANKFVSNDQIVAVVGHMCSSSCIPASDIYEANNFTMLSPSCTAVAFTDRGLAAANRVAWNDAIQGPAAAEFIRNTLGFERVATIHDGSPYGEGLVNEMSQAFEALGGTIVAQEAVNVGDTQMQPVLTKIKSADPQLIYFGGFVAEGAFLASQRADVGMEDVVFMGADGIKATDFIEAAGSAAEGVYASAANPAEAGSGLGDFLAAYEAAYGEAPPAPFHTQAYDAVQVYAKVIGEVGQVSPEGDLYIGRKALNDALHQVEGYQGLSGTISCQENGDCGTGTVAIAQVQDGEWVDLGAPEAAMEQPAEEMAGPMAQLTCEQPVKIGLITDLTGPLAIYGTMTQRSFLLGMEYMAGASGTDDNTFSFGDCDVQIIVKDDQGSAETTATVARELVEVDQVDLLVGTVNSGSTATLQEIAQENDTPLIVAPAAANDITGVNFNEYTFRTSRENYQDFINLCQYLTTAYDTFVQIAPDYSFGYGGASSARDACTFFGGEFVADDIFAPLDTTDFTSYMEQILDSGADAWIVTWAGGGFVPMFQSAAELGVLDQMGLGASYFDNRTMAAIFAPVADKMQGQISGILYHYTAPDNAINDWLVAQVMDRYGEPPDLFDADGMNAAIMAVKALEATQGDTSSQALIAAMEGLEFDGPKGKISVRPEDHVAIQDMYIVKLTDLTAPDFAMFDLVDTTRPEPPCLLPEEPQDRCGDLPVGSLSGQ